jgi:hypothetical protein
VWGEIFNVAIGRAALEACSVTRNLGTNSAFALGPTKTLICTVFFYFLFFFISFFFFFFLFSTNCFLQLFVCAYDLDKHQTVYNTYGKNKSIWEQICTQIYISVIQVKVKVTLRPTISRPVCLGVRRPSGTRNQFFFLLVIFF